MPRLPATRFHDRSMTTAGIRLVGGEHEVQRGPDGGHVGVVEAATVVDRRESGGEQQLVALPQRHLQLLGQVQHHLPAGPRATGLDEAQVPAGHPGLAGQVQLAEPPALPPVAQQFPHGGTRSGAGHPADANAGAAGCRLPRR